MDFQKSLCNLERRLASDQSHYHETPGDNLTANSLRCRIHRGCHEIGGNCVELEACGQRIILDLGLPLQNSSAELPCIDGLLAEDRSLLGVFVSHPHPDHYGLLEQLTTPVPVFMGKAARRLIETSAFFTRLPTLGDVQPQTYEDGSPLQLGPFTVTPVRIDHSAFDSYCLLVEAEGKRLFYSGDIRGHGGNAHLFQSVLDNPPPKIDVLICEGTHIGRIPDFAYPDEKSVADGMLEVFQQTEGMCLVWCSSQNVDRIASVWEACRRSGRNLILDLYTAEILRAVDDPSLPTPGKDGVKMFLPHNQRSRIIRENAHDILDPYSKRRIYPEYLNAAAPSSVMIFRPSMLEDLKRAECLNGASLITSVWSGYLLRNEAELTELKRMNIERFQIHTSGHATADEIRRFVAAFPESRVVPIHSENPSGFTEMAERVELKNDGEWWVV
ncbi:MBL fold metallo-hydrolase [Blastopirellula sp. JC732]|uniref:MBL fold metallo-hydrolase n=1 Tax=Blastopirellula sediminis TaxID=2894196 RepID=A0A9X1SG60_9BACT|nr:MBL fold metallo-hydrolase [Blastopirellula sediminis]MCC9608621.1 MBL fold metallo-hydrolase [Blastopirellula sediminis]MCC9628602.1 MBL fold metallo-hydrolase [Blastopirellula sediminis]